MEVRYSPRIIIHETHPKKFKKVFTIPPLAADSYSYVGPTGAGDTADLCKCNTVVYSLMSACDACQGADWFSYVRFPLSFLALPCRLTKDITMMVEI